MTEPLPDGSDIYIPPPPAVVEEMLDTEAVSVPPRRRVETDPTVQFAQDLKELRRAIEGLERAAPLRNASVSGGEGLRVVGESGVPRVWLRPDGTVVVYSDQADAVGNPMPKVRLGAMLETGAGAGADAYGIEVEVDGTWIQLGTQVVAWDNVGGKPATYDPATGRWDPRPHSHPGDDITSKVASATNADNASTAGSAGTAGTASFANGPTPDAYTRVVAGVPGEWQAVYMHSNGTFGRGSSGIQYKRDVRDYEPAPVLNLRPRVYRYRAATGDEFTPATSAEELGLIAQEVEEFAPELVKYRDGIPDNVFYERLPVAMLPVLQNHEGRLQDHEGRLQAAEEEAVALRLLVDQQAEAIQELRETLKSIIEGNR